MALTKIKLNELTPKADPILADSIVISNSENSGKGALVEITDLQTLIGGGGGGGGAVDSVAGKTGVVTLDADDVSPTSSKLWMSDTQSSKLTGIAENANNYTHPASHPQSMIEGLGDALAAKAPLASPALTGTPTAPTAASGTDTTQIATTEFVQDALAEISIDADPYAVKITGDQSIAGVKTFTSSPVLPTPTAGDNTTKAATTAFVTAAVAGVSGGAVDSVAGKTGVVTLDADDVAPTATKLWMTDTQQSMIDGLSDALAAKAPLASPALTGTPTAPTAAAGTATTQLATTAFCGNFNQKWTYSYTGVGGTISAAAWTMHAFGNSGTLTLPIASSVAAGVQISAIVVDSGAEVVLTRSGSDQFLTPTGLATTYTLKGNGSSIVLVRVTNNAWAVVGAADSMINAAIAPLAPLASPALTGNPTAPTQAAGTNNTRIATTAFVTGAVASKANDADVVKTAGDQSIGGTKTFTSSPVLPTPTAGDNTTKGATTAFVAGAVAGVTASSIGLGSVDNTSDINKPVSTAQAAAIAARRPKHPYVPITTASTAIAAERGNTYGVNANSCTLTLPNAGGTHVDGDEICVVIGVSAERTLAITSPSYILRGTGLQPVNTPFTVSGLGTFISFTKGSNVWIMSYPEYELAGKAPLASPALTGTPTAPTAAAAGTNTTQLATTAFVQAATASAIYDLPVTRTGTVSPGTDVVFLETGVLDPAWYDETHVLNVSFFAQNSSGLSSSDTFKVQLYNEATSTAYTVAYIIKDTLDFDLFQASIYRSSSSYVRCNIQFRFSTSAGNVSLGPGSYKLRVVVTSTLQTFFAAAQVRFTK